MYLFKPVRRRARSIDSIEQVTDRRVEQIDFQKNMEFQTKNAELLKQKAKSFANAPPMAVHLQNTTASVRSMDLRLQQIEQKMV